MPEWRYLAQNILTGEFLHKELPLRRDELTWDLSGPGSLKATIDPENKRLIPFDLWSTAIYAEADNEIRWGGLLQNRGSTGAALTLDCAGFTSYPNRIPYTGPHYKKVKYDPTQVYIDLWNHLQAQPDGNLGMSVVRQGNCPVRIGTTEEPYELAPWEAPDIGQELANLASETPLDYVESHSWSGENITHKTTLAYPRVGRKRDDLAFTPANITSLIPITRSGEAFANTIFGLGKGEGAAMVRSEVAHRDGRLRRPYVYTDKLANTKDRLTAASRKQFAFRQLVPDIDSITVKQHPNAPLFSWSVGDDILIQAKLPWEGDIAIWCRVISWTLTSEVSATLSLVRSDSFSYGGSND